jgi:hypothetical protein
LGDNSDYEEATLLSLLVSLSCSFDLICTVIDGLLSRVSDVRVMLLTSISGCRDSVT